jgi:hypothetical protein
LRTLASSAPCCSSSSSTLGSTASARARAVGAGHRQSCGESGQPPVELTSPSRSCTFFDVRVVRRWLRG